MEEEDGSYSTTRWTVLTTLPQAMDIRQTDTIILWNVASRRLKRLVSSFEIFSQLEKRSAKVVRKK